MRHLLVFAFLLAPVAAPAIDANEMFSDPALEARARDLGRQLRCLKCRNQSIFDSNAGIAKDLRVVVRVRIEAGDTDAEILEYVRTRFGDYVLLQPRVMAETILLWGAPLGTAAIALLAMIVYLRRRGTAQPEPLDEDPGHAQRDAESGRYRSAHRTLEEVAEHLKGFKD